MPTKPSRTNEHWRTLGLMPDAPECVIKAAHRLQIEKHHPDRGGSVADAQRVNVAYDELKGRGARANEHVAAHYDGEPWHVLGLASNADRELVERAGKVLTGDLGSNQRLRAKVQWAVANFGRPARTAVPKPRAAPPPPPARVRAAAPVRHTAPPVPGLPHGLVDSIDFGTLTWESAATRDIRLTWKEFAPYKVDVTTTGPITAAVTASKALPGRFAIAVAIDWDAPEFSGGPSLRGYPLDARMTLRWAAGGEAAVRVRGQILYPAIVSASPDELNLGDVKFGADVRGSVVLVSTAPARCAIEASAWLARVDAAGREQTAPLELLTNRPVRVAFAVRWEPIEQRATGVAAGKPVRPTGKITVRWDAGELVVPVQVVARRPR